VRDGSLAQFLAFLGLIVAVIGVLNSDVSSQINESASKRIESASHTIREAADVLAGQAEPPQSVMLARPVTSDEGILQSPTGNVAVSEPIGEISSDRIEKLHSNADAALKGGPPIDESSNKQSEPDFAALAALATGSPQTETPEKMTQANIEGLLRCADGVCGLSTAK
jgi:hypothetical protein